MGCPIQDLQALLPAGLFAELGEMITPDQFLSDLRNGTVPRAYTPYHLSPDLLSIIRHTGFRLRFYDYMDQIRVWQKFRDAVLALGHSTVLPHPVLDQLADRLRGKRVLEVMAGRGVLAKGLQDRGVEVIATDLYRSGGHRKFGSRVEQMDSVEAVGQYAADCDLLLLSWPKRGASATNTLAQWGNLKADRAEVLYLGESLGKSSLGWYGFKQLARGEDYSDLGYRPIATNQDVPMGFVALPGELWVPETQEEPKELSTQGVAPGVGLDAVASSDLERPYDPIDWDLESQMAEQGCQVGALQQDMDAWQQMSGF
ncbi:class I SAM-dependent methyltransferase [Ferrimonas marina]|uniref:Methyltransferase domain-containing protein n=1 Tax=Ferrimonas marina TaxID=299255 RepID=A0A1M5UCG1_9GAMM|nr:hypothetical protein [Ferrimonas marina]SHH60630.1 hypothetical protein SAMN02745129_2500 [Ferrimonas marina]